MRAQGAEHGAPDGQGARRSAGHRATEPRTGANRWSSKAGLHATLGVRLIAREQALGDVFPLWTYLVTGWTLTANSDGSLTLNFSKIFTARYIKITTIWDDRDKNNASIDKSTFTNTPNELVKVWALVTTRTEGYTYDAMGNRTSVTADGSTQSYTYYKNAQGGNLSWVRYDGSWYYEYDQNGNQILKAKALLAGTLGSEPPDTAQEYWVYTWDLHNRLIAVSKNGQQVVSYTYDAENFRVQRIGTDGTTVYGYDRNAALAYQKNLTSGLTRTIVHLGGEIIGWTDTVGGTSTTYYAATDQLGSVTQVLDANAKVVWQSEYTPFGTVAGAQGSIAFEGMFAGEDIDPDTGLTYQWNRWRSEDGSRWLSEDPIQAGSNYYNYCANSPLNFTDPWGLRITEGADSTGFGGDSTGSSSDGSSGSLGGSTDAGGSLAAAPENSSAAQSAASNGLGQSQPSNAGLTEGPSTSSAGTDAGGDVSGVNPGSSQGSGSSTAPGPGDNPGASSGAPTTPPDSPNPSLSPKERPDHGNGPSSLDNASSKIASFLPGNNWASQAYNTWANGGNFFTDLGYEGLAMMDDASFLLGGEIGAGLLSKAFGLFGRATSQAARGGIGPVLKGQAGVSRAIADIEANGGTVLGREITVEAGGVRTRADLLIRDAQGNMRFVEVKNGPNANLTPNQTTGYPAIRTGGAVPVGGNAAAAGLSVGSPLPPIPVDIMRY